jgi:hypothetical protein
MSKNHKRNMNAVAATQHISNVSTKALSGFPLWPTMVRTMAIGSPKRAAIRAPDTNAPIEVKPPKPST